MNLYFFYDEGERAGSGHYRRIKALAQKCQTIFPNIEYKFIPNASLQTLTNIAHSLKSRQKTINAVVDSYIFKAEHFKLIGSFASTMLCFDDENKDIYPPQSFIINGAPNAHKLYSHITSHHLLGLGFSVCDLCFTPITHINPHIKHIFLSFGGSDIHNLSAKILSYIPKSYTLHLVLGKYYPHTQPQGKNLVIYKDLSPEQMHKAMSVCDVAISAGGGTLIELAASLMPTIMIESAPNQHFQITQFAQLGAFSHAHTPTQIPTLLQTLSPQHIRESYKDTLYNLKIGKDLDSALLAIMQNL